MNEKAMEYLPTVRKESLLLDVRMFEHAQRVGKMLSTSTMVPDHFRNNIGNCIIALNYADRVGIDPFMAMQKMYIIHGKPAVETQLQIALFNKSGQFSALKYKITGTNEEKQCVAYATDRTTGEEIEGPPVSIAMAKAEGWYSKNGSKWKTLPDLMLRYRAAAFFIRLYAPETTLGLYTKEEMQDIGEIIDITPKKENINIIDDIKQKAAVSTTHETTGTEEQPPPEQETPAQEKEPKPERGANIPKTYDEIKREDPEMFLQVINELGFDREPTTAKDKAKVVEAYDFMK